MPSSIKRGVDIRSSGLALSRAGVRLRLALGLFVAAVSLLSLILDPFGAVRAQRAPGLAVLAPQAANPAGARVGKAGTGTVVVNLNPSSSSVAKNQIFTVDIQIVAGGQEVDAAETFLSFSQTYLQVVDADPVTDGVQIQDLTGWDTLLANAVYTGTEWAEIHFSAGIFGSGPKSSGTFSLARIYFKALSSTGGESTPLTFGTEPPYKTKVYSGITWVLDRVENGSVTISEGTPTPTVTATPLMRRVFLPIVMRQR